MRHKKHATRIGFYESEFSSNLRIFFKICQVFVGFEPLIDYKIVAYKRGVKVPKNPLPIKTFITKFGKEYGILFHTRSKGSHYR